MRPSPLPLSGHPHNCQILSKIGFLSSTTRPASSDMVIETKPIEILLLALVWEAKMKDLIQQDVRARQKQHASRELLLLLH